jgi:hypothetical protein
MASRITKLPDTQAPSYIEAGIAFQPMRCSIRYQMILGYELVISKIP